METPLLDSLRPINSFEILKEELIKNNEYIRKHEYQGWNPDDYTGENIQNYNNDFDEIGKQIIQASPAQLLEIIKEKKVELTNKHPREIKFEELETAILHDDAVDKILNSLGSEVLSDVTILSDTEENNNTLMLGRYNLQTLEIETKESKSFSTIEEVKSEYARVTGKEYKSYASELVQAENKGFFVKNKFILLGVPQQSESCFLVPAVSITGQHVTLQWCESGEHAAKENPIVREEKTYIAHYDLLKQKYVESQIVNVYTTELLLKKDCIDKTVVHLEKVIFPDAELYFVKKLIHENASNINNDIDDILMDLKHPSSYRTELESVFTTEDAAREYVDRKYVDKTMEMLIIELLEKQSNTLLQS